MKFKLFFLFLIFLSCSPQLTTYNQKESYAAKGLPTFTTKEILLIK